MWAGLQDLLIIVIAWLLPSLLGNVTTVDVETAGDDRGRRSLQTCKEKRTVASHTVPPFSVFPYIVLKVERWMERQRLALTLSKRAEEEWVGRDKTCRVRKWDGFALDWNLLHVSVLCLAWIHRVCAACWGHAKDSASATCPWREDDKITPEISVTPAVDFS